MLHGGIIGCHFHKMFLWEDYLLQPTQLLPFKLFYLYQSNVDGCHQQHNKELKYVYRYQIEISLE